MSEAKHKCCKTVHGDFSVKYPCRNTAKVERNGKWYCGTHDPEKRKARETLQRSKWDKEFAERQKRWRLESAAPDLLAACKVCLQELESFCHAYHVDASKNLAVAVLRGAIAKAGDK